MAPCALGLQVKVAKKTQMERLPPLAKESPFENCARRRGWEGPSNLGCRSMSVEVGAHVCAHTLTQFLCRNPTVAPGATHELTLAREYRVADDQGDGEAVPEEERIKVYRVRTIGSIFGVRSARFLYPTLVWCMLPAPPPPASRSTASS